MTRKFYRTREGRVFAGVASGLGKYFDIDPVLLRLAFIAACFFGGLGFILYIVLIIVTPMGSENDYFFSKDFVDSEEVADDEIKNDNSTRSEKTTSSQSRTTSVDDEKMKPKPRMHSHHVFGSLLGIIMILIGLAFVFRSFGVIWFSWGSLFYLWPLFLMLMGVSMIRMKSWLRMIFFAIILLLGIAVMTLRGSRCFPWWGSSHSECIYVDGAQKNQTTFFAELEREGKHSDLDLSVGATSLTIKEGGKEWLEIYRNGALVKSLTLMGEQKQEQKWSLNGFFPDDDLNLLLNPDCLWTLNVRSGAADLLLDLKNILVEEVDLDLGAASAEIIVGDRHPSTKVEVNAGVAAVKIRIPKNSGCEVFSNTVMSSRNYNGFRKESGRYVSDNFDSATQIVRIYIHGAMNSLELERY